jgi:hypothetical protein
LGLSLSVCRRHFGLVYSTFKSHSEFDCKATSLNQSSKAAGFSGTSKGFRHCWTQQWREGLPQDTLALLPAK